MMGIVLIACLLLVATTVIHAATTKGISNFVNKHTSKREDYFIPKSYWIVVIIILLFFITILEASLWALAYLALDVISGFEEALYFSLVSYTTLGFGDITLAENYRLLSSFEAANGIIIFGWSTAIVMAVVQRIYFTRYKNKNASVTQD